MQRLSFQSNFCTRQVSVAVLAGFCCFGCQRQKASPAAQVPTASPSSVALPGSSVAADAPRGPAVAESSDGQLTTFDDPETGVRFQYPSSWRPWHDGSPMFASSFISDTAGPARITEVFTPEGKEWQKKNLIGISFAYSVKKDLSPEKCTELLESNGSLSSASAETINGITYQRKDGGDAAMCHRVQITVNAASHHGVCYFFERDVQTTCPGVRGKNDPVDLTTAQQHTLNDQLAKVMGSVTLR